MVGGWHILRHPLTTLSSLEQLAMQIAASTQQTLQGQYMEAET
jgi:hypothetical protein